MKIGVIADTHNALERTRIAVGMLIDHGAHLLIHCGDFTEANVLEACTVLPLYFVFGNNDSDNVPQLRQAARECGAHCLEWAGSFQAGGRTLAVAHGHLTTDIRRVMNKQPDYLFTGHSHMRSADLVGECRRINPGALYRACDYSVALVDLATNEVSFLDVQR